MSRRVSRTGRWNTSMRSTGAAAYSVLDLCPIRQGGSAADAFREAADLARHAEAWGYLRYWIAEHHNIPGVASAATAVVIGHVAAATSTIRVGAGGIMLPNHPPLVVAEQFGTLESLYPGRVDLGLGRAPGGDLATIYALRRDPRGGDDFPADLRELQSYFRKGGPDQRVRAVPGEGLEVPLYVLGSSNFGARVAAEFGLPFAFASHFAPDALNVALGLYRERFRPSATLRQPYAMIGANVFAADTDEEARRMFTSLQQAFLNLVRGRPGLLSPPVDSINALWNSAERRQVERMTAVSAVGSLDTVRGELQRIVADTGADEVIVTAQIYEHAARLRSFEITAEAFAHISGLRPGPGASSQRTADGS